MYMQFGRFLSLAMAALLPLVTLGDEGGSLIAGPVLMENPKRGLMILFY